MVVVVGSTKFKQLQQTILENLLLEGGFPIQITNISEDFPTTSSIRKAFDEYVDKVLDDADSVYIVNPMGYMDRNMARVVDRAIAKEKNVVYHPPDDSSCFNNYELILRDSMDKGAGFDEPCRFIASVHAKSMDDAISILRYINSGDIDKARYIYDGDRKEE